MAKKQRWSISILLLTILLVALLVGCSSKKPETIEESLLGEWKAQSIDGQVEADIQFVFSGGEYIGKYNLYDYTSNKWATNNFKLKSVDNFTLTLLLDTGEIEQLSFAVSKDTLFLSGIAYTNATKSIPTDRKDTYVKDGIITPILDDVFLGMTEAEFNRTDFRKSCTTKMSGFDLPDNFYKWYPEDTGTSWANSYFPSGKLTALVLYLDYGFDEKTSTFIAEHIIDEYTSKYGTYTLSNGKYGWATGNIYITFDTTTEYWYTLEYSLYH